MKNKSFSTITLLILLAVPVSLSAHHSVGLFDTSTPIWVKGTVIRVDFNNPHAVIYLEEHDDDGQVLHWLIESSPTLSRLHELGFTKTTINPGDVIEACGYAPKQPFLSSRLTNPVSRGPWLDNPDRVITGRLLLLSSGPAEHWSHYGPLEQCND